MTDVLVFLPGLLGSELYDGQTKVWPGSLMDGVFGFSDEEFALLLKDDLEPRSIIETAAGVVDIYGSWVKHFESMRRRADNSRMFRRDDRTLVLVPYDWRKSIAMAAELLAKAVEQSVQHHGSDTKIHIAAHSLGGLVGRYYLQSGKFDTRPGFDMIATLLTLGTPHNGATIALAAVLGLHKTNFLSTAQSKQLANDPRFPALYQTFPVPTYPLLWTRGKGTNMKASGLSDLNVALGQLGLNNVSYNAYLDFRRAIDSRPIPASVRLVAIMGTGYETLTHLQFDGSVQKSEAQDGGDGTVAFQGGYLPNVQTKFVSEAHVTLLNARDAREAFQEVFDAVGMLAAGAGQLQLSVRDLVVGVQQPISVLIVSDGTVTNAEGRFILETAPAEPGGAAPTGADFFAAPGRVPVPFLYRGPGLVNAAVTLPAVTSQGVYRVVIELGPAGTPATARFTSPAFVVNTLS